MFQLRIGSSVNKKVGIKKNKLALKNSEKEEKTDFYKSENFGDVTLHLLSNQNYENCL
jgi:hypothetical protein